MKCFHRKQLVFGDRGITVPQHGPAHIDCAEKVYILRRQFKGLDLTLLSDEELAELEHFIELEKNARSSCNDIELF